MLKKNNKMTNNKMNTLKQKYFLSVLNIDFKNVDEIDIRSLGIVNIEEKTFHEANRVSKLNIESNLIKTLIKDMLDCGDCCCLYNLAELNLRFNRITGI